MEAGLRESDIHKHVIDRWRKTGKPNTLLATIPNQRAFGQYGLTKGLPDLVAIAPGLPVGFIELKTERGRVSPDQQAFIDLCRVTGVRCAITRGLDEAIGILIAWGVVREEARAA